MRAPCRVVLTRTPADNVRLRAALAGVPAEIVDYPCLSIDPIRPSEAIVARVRENAYASAFFVSRAAVEHFFAQVSGDPPPVVVGIGESTAKALDDHGWTCTAMPSAPTIAAVIDEASGGVGDQGESELATDLVSDLTSKSPSRGGKGTLCARPKTGIASVGARIEAMRVCARAVKVPFPSREGDLEVRSQAKSLFPRTGPLLYVCGDLSDAADVEKLRSSGYDVDVAVVYRNSAVPKEPLPTNGRPTLIVFASPSAVRGFGRGPQAGEVALAIGPTTAEAAKKVGFPVMTASAPSIEALARSAREWAGQHEGEAP